MAAADIGALRGGVAACASGRLLAAMGATTIMGGGSATGLLTATTGVWGAAGKLVAASAAGLGEALAEFGAPAVCFASLTGFPKVPRGRKNPGGGVAAVAPDRVAGGGLAPSQPSNWEKIRHR